MTKEERIRFHANKLKLVNLKNNLDSILEKADQESPSYLGFLDQILIGEIEHRKETTRARRIRQAHFPEIKTVEEFDLENLEGLTKKNLNQLLECEWVRKKFNLIMIGPPGIGKTHLAISLGLEAINQGYTVSFVTIKELVNLLTDQDLNVHNKARLKRLYTDDLIIIDEVGYYPFNAVEGGQFFHFLNELHEKTSFLLTSNKPFNQWPEFFGDEDLVLAALDRLLFHCDVLNLNGNSYRLENRQSLLI